MEATGSERGRRRRRSKRPPSLSRRFSKWMQEQRRRVAVTLAFVLSCGGALLIYMMIRPE
jgi:hypothetical protein